MKFPYEFWIGINYTGLKKLFNRRKSNNFFISFIEFSSMFGIMLGVSTLIIVLSVMNGFQKDVRDRMLSILPHIEVLIPNFSSDEILKKWKMLYEIIKKENKNIIGGAPFITAQTIIIKDKLLYGAQVRGINVSSEKTVSNLSKKIVNGSLDFLDSQRFGLIVGIELAKKIGVKIGDELVLCSSEIQNSFSGLTPRIKKFKIVATFSSGHYEYDSNLVFMNSKDASLFFANNNISGIRLSVNNIHSAPRISKELSSIFSEEIIFNDWSNYNKTWFEALKIEKRMMFLILVLIIAISAFNLLSSMVMSVKDKSSDIAILRTLGASKKNIYSIFLIQGLIIGITGTVMGIIIGLITSYHLNSIVFFIESLFNIHFLSSEIYFISNLPIDIKISDIVIISGTSLMLSILAVLYPSWRASNLQPAKILRYGR